MTEPSRKPLFMVSTADKTVEQIHAELVEQLRAAGVEVTNDEEDDEKE